MLLFEITSHDGEVILYESRMKVVGCGDYPRQENFLEAEVNTRRRVAGLMFGTIA